MHDRAVTVNAPMPPAHEPPAGAGPARTATLELADVYRDHFAFVYRSLLRLGIPRSVVEDVAQDVFLVVRRRLGDYDRNRSLSAWLFGIARRVASEWRRSTGRAQRRLDLLPPPPEGETAARSAELGEAAELVRNFLAELDEDHRLVFVLSELEGLSGTEIAEALATNRNTVYTRLRKVRARFEHAIARAQEVRA
jgi:RNA polymerase sigma-70 factor (ECF subfamily)